MQAALKSSASPSFLLHYVILQCIMSADTLDDNFELDDGLLADEVSGDEEPSQAGPSKRSRVIDEEEEDDLVSGSDVEDEEAEENEQSPPAKRTKIAKPAQQGQPALSAEEKKRKRKEKQKEAKVGRDFPSAKPYFTLTTSIAYCLDLHCVES